MEFDLSTPVRAILALILVVGLIGLVVWLVRRFNTDRLGNASARGRQPRLAVIDAAAVDGRRRLVLIRRDNVEHLLMIGGPTDVVVELNIVRAGAPAREPQPVRPPPAADPLPRPVPLGEGTMWPLQPEPVPRPEPVARTEPAPRPEPTPRPPRASVPMVEEPVQWSEPEAPPRHLPRRASAGREPPTRSPVWPRSWRVRPLRPSRHRPSRRRYARPLAASRVRRGPRPRHLRHRQSSSPSRSPPPTRTSPIWHSGSRPHCVDRRGARTHEPRPPRRGRSRLQPRARSTRRSRAHRRLPSRRGRRAWRAAVRTRSRAGGPAEIALRQPRAGDGEPARTSGREILTAHCPSAESDLHARDGRGHACLCVWD